jgi:hypothetical protein
MLFINSKGKIKHKANKANIKQTHVSHTGGGTSSSLSSSKGHGESSSTKVFTAGI